MFLELYVGKQWKEFEVVDLNGCLLALKFTNPETQLTTVAVPISAYEEANLVELRSLVYSRFSSSAEAEEQVRILLAIVSSDSSICYYNIA